MFIDTFKTMTSYNTTMYICDSSPTITDIKLEHWVTIHNYVIVYFICFLILCDIILTLYKVRRLEFDFGALFIGSILFMHNYIYDGKNYIDIDYSTPNVRNFNISLDITFFILYFIFIWYSANIDRIY